MSLKTQWFVPVLKTEDGDIWTPSITDSQALSVYVSNDKRVNIVYKYILEEADTVAWMGEYSSLQIIRSRFIDNEATLEEFSQVIEKIPLPEQLNTIMYKLPDTDNQWIQDAKATGYLINVTKKEYVTLNKWSKEFSSGIDPLPYLTVISGDPLMGNWAFDKIMFSQAFPGKKYKELTKKSGKENKHDC